MFRFALGLLAALLVAGTVFAAGPVPSEKFTAFKKGVTTRAEVLAALGPPTPDRTVPATHIRYDYTVPVTDKNPTGQIIILCVFDAQDLYQGVQFFVPNPAQGAQPLLPPGSEPPPDLKYENVLMPLPDGFAVGAHYRQGPSELSEWVPAGETVKDWSRLVTEQIIHGRGHADPEELPTAIAKSWAAACPGGVAEPIGKASENGYPVSTWMFRCPLNPQTGKPENMWMKVIAGSDALYDIQYAYRSTVSNELAGRATSFLARVKVCDTRGADHPCPALKPVTR